MTPGHDHYCNCFECVPDHVDAILSHRPAYNYADVADLSNHTADYYIDSTLVAKKNVTTYSKEGYDKNGNPSGKVVNKYSPSDVVGEVYSFVVDPLTKQVWWELKDNSWVQHFPGYFDIKTANATSGNKALTDKLKVLEDSTDFGSTLLDGAKKTAGAVEDSVSGIFGNLKWYILAVAVILVIALFLRIRG